MGNSAALHALSTAGNSISVSGTSIEFAYTSMEEAFPAVDPGVQPFGNYVLVQIRQPKRQTRGGVILTTEDRHTEFYNTQVAKVIAIGPLAFHNRDTMKLWPEGAWCKIGDFVRIPKYQGDRFSVPFAVEEDVPWNGIKRREVVKDEAIFTIFKDLALLGLYTGDVLAVKAYM